MRFECQESCGGKCCTLGTTGSYVFLTKEDAERIHAHTGLPLYDFGAVGEFTSTRFTDKKSVQWFIKPAEGTQDCRFFKEGKCTIHSARPTQCRTFPYWPELVRPEQWEKLSEVCPGINKGDGRLHTAELLAKQMQADEELCKNCNP